MVKYFFWIGQLILFQNLSLSQNSEFNSNFFGFTQIRVINTWEDNQKSTMNFQLNKIRIGINGQVSERLRYLGLFEGGAVAPTPYSISPLDLHVSYKFFPELEVRIGQDWYKIGWEYSQPIPTLLFISFSDFASEVFDRMGRNGFYGYDIGIWLNGIIEMDNIIMGYNAGILNGTGLNNIDDNNKKDLFFRAYIEPIKYAHLGVSAFNGYSTIDNEDLKDQIYALEVILRIGEFMSSIEYYYSQNAESKTQVNQYPEIIKRGFYSFLSYNYASYQIFFRYEVNQSLYQQGEVGKVFTFGVNYLIKELNKISLNYVHRNYNERISEISNQLTLQIQICINDF